MSCVLENGLEVGTVNQKCKSKVDEGCGENIAIFCVCVSVCKTPLTMKLPLTLGWKTPSKEHLE